MNWVLHDIYKTASLAQKYGKDVVEIGLAKGIKVVLNKSKTIKSFELHILPITQGE